MNENWKRELKSSFDVINVVSANYPCFTGVRIVEPTTHCVVRGDCWVPIIGYYYVMVDKWGQLFGKNFVELFCFMLSVDNIFLISFACTITFSSCLDQVAPNVHGFSASQLNF